MFTQYYRSTIRSSNLTGTCNNHKLKPRPILNAVVRPGIIRFRKGLSLFTGTLIGTLVGRRRQFTQNSTLTTSIATVELRFQNRGSPTIRQQQPIGSIADRSGNNFFFNNADNASDQSSPTSSYTNHWQSQCDSKLRKSKPSPE